MDAVTAAFQAASAEMYAAMNNQQGGAQPGPDFGGFTGGNAGNAGGTQSGSADKGDVTDVDFEEVK